MTPSIMDGYGAPDGSYGGSYPWNVQVFACPGQQGADVNCFQYRASPGAFRVPVILRQNGAPDTTLFLNGFAFAGRDDPFGNTAATAWTPPSSRTGRCCSARGADHTESSCSGATRGSAARGATATGHSSQTDAGTGNALRAKAGDT